MGEKQLAQTDPKDAKLKAAVTHYVSPTIGKTNRSEGWTARVSQQQRSVAFYYDIVSDLVYIYMLA